jgi:hypothetical protein
MKPIRFNQRISAFLLISACFIALPGCQKQEGPMEKAGKEFDQAVENFGQPKEGPVERAGQAVDDAAEAAGQKLEQAGEHIQDAAKD